MGEHVHRAEQHLDQVNGRTPRHRDGEASLRAAAFPEGGHQQAPEPARLGVRSPRVQPGHPAVTTPDPLGE